MKKTLFILLSCITLMGSDWFLPIRDRHCEIGETPSITLVKNNKINFEIIAGNTPAAIYAAEIVSRELGRVFNTEIPIKKHASGTKPALLVGTIKADIPDRDGFIIKTENQNVIIAGKDDSVREPFASIVGFSPLRGTVYAAFEFLEKFADVRFYWPGNIGTVAPLKHDWALPEINIYDRPDWTQISFYNDCYNGQGQPLSKEELIFWRQSTVLPPGSHGLAYLGFVQRFAKKHPEYFALTEKGTRICGNNPDEWCAAEYGHICPSSGIKDEIIKDAIAFLSHKSAASRNIIMPDGKSYWSYSRYPTDLKLFSVSLNDGTYLCKCPRCWKHFSQGNKETNNFFWNFFVSIATAVKQSGVDGSLFLMAYGARSEVPEVDLPDNMLIQVALKGPWSIDDSQYARLSRWHRKLKGQRLLTWCYPSKYSITLPGVPYVAPNACGKFCKRIAPMTVGSFFEAGSERPSHNYLNFYIFSKIGWNNNVNIQLLLNDYYNNMFGNASAWMKKFHEKIENNWMKIVTNSIMTEQGPVVVPPSYKDIWGKIYSETELKKLESFFEKSYAVLKHDPLSTKRVEFIQKELLNPIQKEREKWCRTISSREQWKVSVPGSLSLFPTSGAADVHTLVNIKSDSEYFYFNIDCEEPHTDKIIAVKRPHDDINLWRDSSIEIFLNPSGDRLNYYQISANALGCLTDIRRNKINLDYSWDSGTKVKTAIVNGKKWTVEFIIPKNSLGQISPSGFPINIFRFRALNGIKLKTTGYHWTPGVRKNNEIEQWGQIKFNDDKKKSLVRNGDFEGTCSRNYLNPPEGNWQKGIWAANGKIFPLDTRFYLTGQASARLKQGECTRIIQNIPELKPGKKYILSFYVKLNQVIPQKTGRGFYLRIYENEHKAHCMTPWDGALSGTLPWTRQEIVFKTSNSFSIGQVPPRLDFILSQGAGTAWIDHVRMYEEATK